MENVRAVERALELLECFSKNKSEIGLSELARMLMLPKATVFRIASTLEDKGYLLQDPERQAYRLGPKAAALGNAFLTNLDYRTVALPLMKHLRDEIQETVSLYISVENQYRMCVQRVESPHVLRQFINIGDRLPLNRGSAGKLLIAFQNLAVDLEGLEPGEIVKIRKQGYATSFEERERGLASISAPIFDSKGEAIASLTVSGPSFRFSETEKDRYIRKTVETAQQISFRLGHLA